MTQEQRPSRLKVVLEELEQGMAVGIQAKGCDPLISVLPGATLEQALARVPELVTRARERWAERPQYPVYQRPPEPARPQTATVSRRPRSTRPEVVQQRFM